MWPDLSFFSFTSFPNPTSPPFSFLFYSYLTDPDNCVPSLDV